MTKRAPRLPQRRKTITAPDGAVVQIFEPDEVTFPDIPDFYSGSVQISLVGNDLVFVFSKPKTGTVNEGGQPVAVATQAPVVQVVMNAMSAKEFSIVLSDIVDKFEEANGSITTEFTRSRTSKN